MHKYQLSVLELGHGEWSQVEGAVLNQTRRLLEGGNSIDNFPVRFDFRALFRARFLARRIAIQLLSGVDF